MRVIEGREQTRLALEARQAVGVRRKVIAKDLDRDVAPQLGVARTVNLTHAARTDGIANLVSPEPGSNKAHICSYRGNVARW